VLRITFELQQEPMRFIFVLRITFELLQEPMRIILVLPKLSDFNKSSFVFRKWTKVLWVLERH